MSDFLDIFDALNHPAHRHAMLVHWPIALTILGLVFAVLAVLLPKNKLAKAVALGAYGLLLIMSWVTVQSGEAAHHAIAAPLSNEVHELIERHEDMAEKLWWFVAGALVLIAVGFFGPMRLRIWASWIALAINLAAVGWVSITAHLGGTLVYEHAVGTGRAAGSQIAPSAPTTEPENDQEHEHQHGAFGSATNASPASPAQDENISKTDSAGDSRTVVFREQVWPILEARCVKCHNPARVAANKSGRLDQSTLEGLLKGGRSGPAIVPGKPEESLLIQRVRGLVPEEELMPPPPADPLTEQQIAALEQWIRDGAVWGDAE